MDIYENRYRLTEHGWIGFRCSDSEVSAVEASGESRDERLHRLTQLKHNHRLTGGACVTSVPATPGTRNAVVGMVNICSTPSRPHCQIPLCSRVIYSVGNKFLIVLLAS